MPNLKFQGSSIRMVRRFCDSSFFTKHLFIHGFNSGLYLVDIVYLDVKRVVSLESVQEASLRNILTLLEEQKEPNTQKAAKLLLQLSFRDFQVNKDFSTFLVFFVRELSCSFTFSFNSWGSIYD